MVAWTHSNSSLHLNKNRTTSTDFETLRSRHWHCECHWHIRDVTTEGNLDSSVMTLNNIARLERDEDTSRWTLRSIQRQRDTLLHWREKDREWIKVLRSIWSGHCSNGECGWGRRGREGERSCNPVQLGSCSAPPGTFEGSKTSGCIPGVSYPCNLLKRKLTIIIY